jgi:hypothetical protein
MDMGDTTSTDDAQLLSYKDWTILLAEESLVDFGNYLILIGVYVADMLCGPIGKFLELTCNLY